jgi:hypothetical protein
MHSLTVLDLDTVAWEPGKIAESRDAAAASSDVARFCDSNQHWIVEGCYAGLAQVALLHTPALLFLDPGLEMCLENCRDRPWERHKYPTQQSPRAQ